MSQHQMLNGRNFLSSGGRRLVCAVGTMQWWCLPLGMLVTDRGG